MLPLVYLEHPKGSSAKSTAGFELMAPLSALPDELLLSNVFPMCPCREIQIRSLATLLSASTKSCRNIVLFGLGATGKTSTTEAVLNKLVMLTADGNKNTADRNHQCRLQFVIIDSLESVSGRHLLEQIIGEIARKVGWPGSIPRCENLAQLVVEVGRLMRFWRGEGDGQQEKRFVLVCDGIDRQREAQSTLLPALARLSEIIPQFTTIFITSSPRPNFLHFPGAPFIYYPCYTKLELMKILALHDPVPQLPGGRIETLDVWSKFCSVIWDSLATYSGRDLLSFKYLCIRLWPIFVRPIMQGTHSSSQFGGVLIANKTLLQNDDHLVPKLICESGDDSIILQATRVKPRKDLDFGAQLPFSSRLLLVAAYFASYNPARTDQLFFMKATASKRRKKGGGTAKTRQGPGRPRKISRRLLGPQAFGLERMLAIFNAIKPDAGSTKRHPGSKLVTGSADIQMAIASLTSLRLLIKMGSGSAADSLDGSGKWRVAIGWDVIRGIARGVGLEAEDYLME